MPPLNQTPILSLHPFIDFSIDSLNTVNKEAFLTFGSGTVFQRGKGRGGGMTDKGKDKYDFCITIFNR